MNNDIIEYIEDILDFRLCEMGINLEYYKKLSKDDEDEQDTILDNCIEVLNILKGVK